MKKILLFFGVYLCFQAVVTANCEIHLAADQAPPYTFKNSDGSWSGFVVEHVSAIAKEAKCNLVVKNLPWARSFQLLKIGEVDLLGTLSITEERKEFLHFIGPHYYQKTKILVPKDSNLMIEKLSDLQNLPRKIAMFRGSWFGNELETLLQDKNFAKRIDWVTGTKGLPATLERIRLGRLSGFITSVIPGKSLTEKYKGLKFHPFLVYQAPAYFGVSKKAVNEKKLQILQKATERLIAQNEFEKILKKYE